MSQSLTLFWFRRDLRLFDNVGLSKALISGDPVLPIFIFDPEILDQLPEKDSRVSFIHETLKLLDSTLITLGSTLEVHFDKPLKVFSTLLKKYALSAVFTNHDYEPYALKRDKEVGEFLKKNGIPFKTFKDQVIFETDEIVKDNGEPYVVYSPYMKKWKEVFHSMQNLPIEEALVDRSKFFQTKPKTIPALTTLGFQQSEIKVPIWKLGQDRLKNYRATRDFPAKQGTSFLSPHLRFGTVSIREIVREALAVSEETFLNELIWREFFMQILWHFPHTVSQAFKPQYDRISWRNNKAEFQKWKEGQTGYVLVDAGMRELNATGLMHNRVRMVVASFLCKHLLIDWRWGEAYFAEKLLDFELASNVGNWQWAAGSGVDAAPYFRIFNPMTQATKFDGELVYVKKWVPEFQTFEYPAKMVDHKMARERCLNAYKKALQ